MTAIAPAGRDWVGMLQARDAAKHGREKQYSKSDPQFLLQVITEEWRAFGDHLSRAEQSFASELRETRNQWAHGDAFSADDTYRALDTIERLLTAVDAAARSDRGPSAAAGCAAFGAGALKPAGRSATARRTWRDWA